MPNKPTPRQFVEAWETSESLREVEEKTGIKGAIAAARASLYRSRGIHLKKMKVGRKTSESVEELNKLIEELGGMSSSEATVKTAAQQADKTAEQLRLEAQAHQKHVADVLGKVLGNKKKKV